MRKIYQKNLGYRNDEVRPVEAFAETPGFGVNRDEISRPNKDALNEERRHLRQQEEKARKLKEFQLEVRRRVEHFRWNSPTENCHKDGTWHRGISGKHSPSNSTAKDATFMQKASMGEKLMHVTLTAPEGGHLLSLLSSPFDGNQEWGRVTAKRKPDVTAPSQKTEADKKRLHITLTTPRGKQLLSLISSPTVTSRNARTVRGRQTLASCVSVKPGVEKELNRQKMLQELLQRKRLLSNDDRRRMKSESERRKENAKASRLKKEKEKIRKEQELRLKEQQMNMEDILKREKEKQKALQERVAKQSVKKAEERQSRSIESQRYHTALKANVRRRIKELNLDIPPLCPCHPSVWDADTNLCAVNCVFYRKPQMYDQLLQSMVANFSL